MKSLTIYVNARTNSQRCKNKLLRTFVDTTLLDIALKKLKVLSSNYNVVFSAHEDILLDKAKSLDLPVYERSYESSIAEENIQGVFEVLGYVDTEYVAFLNACCPFLSVGKIETAVDQFIESDCISMSCVYKAREWLFHRNGNLVLDMSGISTKTCDYVWRVTHSLNIYPRERFYLDEIIWKGVPNDPELFEIDRIESLDVDYEDEFYACEQVYKNKFSPPDNLFVSTK